MYADWVIIMKKYNKLVRDNIPTIIQNDGRQCNYKILDDSEYLKELNKKLIEEVNEFVELNEIEELADVFEVIETIMNHLNYTVENVNIIKQKKAEKNGSFKEKIFLMDSE